MEHQHRGYLCKLNNYFDAINNNCVRIKSSENLTECDTRYNSYHDSVEFNWNINGVPFEVLFCLDGKIKIFKNATQQIREI